MNDRLRWCRTLADAEAQLRRDEEEGHIPWAPSARTLSDWITKGYVIRPPTPESPWTLLHARDDAPLVVDVLPIAARTGARPLSLREGQILATIRRATGDIPPVIALTLAAAYAAREERHLPTRDMDLYLGAAPWRCMPDETEDRRAALVEYVNAANAAGLPAWTVSDTRPGATWLGVWVGGIRLRSEGGPIVEDDR